VSEQAERETRISEIIESRFTQPLPKSTGDADAILVRRLGTVVPGPRRAVLDPDIHDDNELSYLVSEFWHELHGHMANETTTVWP